MRLAIGLMSMIAAGCLAGAAQGQCNVYRWHVPDFDQKRSALPADGGMYCVPTSATNWMAYISNHGYPAMMSGPRDWQSQVNYGFVTSTAAQMGALMGTDPVDGTGGNGAAAGLNLYLLAHAPFKFTATHWNGTITPLDMWLQMQTNGLVNICYGYYEQIPGPSGNYYVRNGGHCVTLNGVENICTAGADPVVRLRNPADDATLTTQSTFSTVTSRAIVETFAASPLPGINKTLTRMADFGVGSTTRRYVDSMYVIRSLFNCWAPATSTPEIKITFVAAMFGDPTPPERTIALPAGSLANAVAVHPDQSKVVYVRRTLGGAGVGYRLRLLNPLDGTDTDLMALTPPVAGKTPIVFDRLGRLITCDGSVLKAIDLSTRAPVVVAMRTLASPASGISLDDMHDEIVVLTPGNARLLRCSMDLVSAIDEPLPPGLPAMGDGSVTPDPVNRRFLIATPGDGSVRELSLVPGSDRLMLQSTLVLPAVQSIQDIQPGDGGMFFAMGDGSVRVLDRDPSTGALRVSPNQLFGGMPAMRCMSLTRSRTNFDPALHTGPAWVNILNPQEGAVSRTDCPADYNLNGTVEVQDIFDFINGWFASDPHADTDDSASLSVQDIFDFINLWLAGCP